MVEPTDDAASSTGDRRSPRQEHTVGGLTAADLRAIRDGRRHESSGRRLFCIIRPELAVTDAQYRAACRDRQIGYTPVAPGPIWLPPEQGPRPGDLLYRAAVEVCAEQTEAVLLATPITSLDRAPGVVRPFPRGCRWFGARRRPWQRSPTHRGRACCRSLSRTPRASGS